MIANIRKYVLGYRKDTLHYLDEAKRTIDGHGKSVMALQWKGPILCEWIMQEHTQEAKEDGLHSLSQRM
jgi:hypothetical protein